MTDQQDVGPSVIQLDISDEIREKQLVTEVTSSFGSRSVIVKLNHEYKNKAIEVYPIEPQQWEYTPNIFENALGDRGVDKEDCIALRRLLNINSKKIADHYAKQQEARMTTGQQAKKERTDRLKNGAPIELSIKKVLKKHDGNFRVRGMINGLGRIEKMFTAVGFRCQDCDSINTVVDNSGSRPRLVDEIPRLKISNMRCSQGCQPEEVEPPFYHEHWKAVVNAQKIVLFDTEIYNDLESLNVILLDDHIDNVVSGENVIITGSAQRVTVRNKSSTYLFVGLNDKIDGFELVNKRESVAVNGDDEKTVREFVTDSKGSLNPYTKLVAPSIIGYDHVKKGLLICAVNSGRYP